MAELTVGDAAPEFEATLTDGSTAILSEMLVEGKGVILYFYPRDDTPGCTREACAYRDAFPEFEKKNTVILGVSPDDEKSHIKFIKKFTHC